ncbi:MAG: hypothetical protein HC817_04540 [Saprospiraceae bacterium]|nr:hypothetical protein [Saprospiraceae bacterium]
MLRAPLTTARLTQNGDAIGAVLKDFMSDQTTSSWVFEPGGTFVENTNGTARLKAVLSYFADRSKRRMEIDVTFIGQTFTPPMGSPVLMNTNPASTAGWYYYDWGTATLTGLNDLAGMKLNLKKRGKAFQFGIGGADQVPDVNNLSGTGWFAYDIVTQPTNRNIVIRPFSTDPSIDQADICFVASGTPTVCGSDPCATDTEKPKIANCPANISLTTTGTCANAQWAIPTITDNCGTPQYL